MLSLFSLVSLIGVMLGVTVLVVVMSVYSGLERDVKQRMLGYTPHVLLHHPDGDSPDGRMTDWRAAADRVVTLPSVASATAYVSDNVIIDVNSGQRPVLFRGIDSSDKAQVEGVAKLLDKEAYPGSTADMGLDDRVVISSILATQLGLVPGDKIRLYSTRNFEEVMRVYKATENPPVREAFADGWRPASETLKHGWNAGDNHFTLDFNEYRQAYQHLAGILDQQVRHPEATLLTEILLAMDQSEKIPAAGEPLENPANGVFRFDASTKEKIAEAVAKLETTEAEQMDADTFKSLKSVILPKEAEVTGVYRASMMAVTPDIFMPLDLAQTLAGLGDAVQGIAVRLDDPYRAETWAVETRRALGADWTLVTWGDQARDFFRLIEQQRGMMYLVLSLIVVISAFSMMAVMFTITIQKRREIGVMRALGAAPGQIVRVFLYQGMLLGTLGAILGIALGRLIVYFRGELQAVLRAMNFDPFSASLTGFTTLPAYNDWEEQLKFGIMAFALCSIAALVPAFFASRSDAAKSLRNL